MKGPIDCFAYMTRRNYRYLPNLYETDSRLRNKTNRRYPLKWASLYYGNLQIERTEQMDKEDVESQMQETEEARNGIENKICQILNENFTRLEPVKLSERDIQQNRELIKSWMERTGCTEENIWQT